MKPSDIGTWFICLVGPPDFIGAEARLAEYDDAGGVWLSWTAYRRGEPFHVEAEEFARCWKPRRPLADLDYRQLLVKALHHMPYSDQSALVARTRESIAFTQEERDALELASREAGDIAAGVHAAHAMRAMGRRPGP